MSSGPGLHLLYEPESREATVDIIFVHGLGGGHLSTWSENGICWPRDLLKEDLPEARIFSSAYDSKVLKLAESASRTTIAGHAESLLNELSRERQNLRALVRSSEYYYNSQPHHTVMGSIFPSTLGVLFLGTPHRGSGKATAGKTIAIACKALGANSEILKALERDSSLLEQQRNSFDSIRPRFITVCLWEELPMPVLGMVGFTALEDYPQAKKCQIVPESSACIDGPDILREHIPGAHHRSMAKFADRGQKGYNIITSYLKRLVDKIPHGKAADIADRCILESFKFSGMNQRFADVSRAHRRVTDSRSSTFDWVFSRNKSDFVTWLEGDDGLFWIQGKAGSGKSTLMKFMVEDPRLKAHLMQKDRSGLPILFEKFFFWSAGTPEERSQTGLIKTILHGILNAYRRLVRLTFPDEWPVLYEAAGEMYQKYHAQSTAGGSRNLDLLLSTRNEQRALAELSALAKLSWTRDQMVQCITEILRSSNFRTVLFIDGLDEYDGTEDDLEELIMLLKTWAEMPFVKICVSTRPWTIFETHFGKQMVPFLRLQDMTEGDISAFVIDSFNSSPSMKVLHQANPEKIVDFYGSITRKAEGVFLWVRLVVKSLMSGLRNGEELSVLQERVNELSADLEKLYWQLLQRIPKRYWGPSARLFSIMEKAREPLRSLTLWYAGERGYEPFEFHLSDATKQARCYQIYLRLMSQCAGLLEVRFGSELNLSHGKDDEDVDIMRPNMTWNFSTQQQYINSTIHYLHRTTRDFLVQKEVQDLLNERVRQSSFDSSSWLAIHAFIALEEVRCRIEKAGHGSASWGMFGSELRYKESSFEAKLAFATPKVSELLRSLHEPRDNQVVELEREEYLAGQPEMVLKNGISGGDEKTSEITTRDAPNTASQEDSTRRADLVKLALRHIDSI